MQISLSAVIIARNEEKNIVDCIETLSFCDEIVVVDDASTDRTVGIVENLANEKIKVFSHELENDFASQRNYAAEKAKGAWILFVDADERVSKTLAKEITFAIENKTIKGYYLVRRDHMWGKELKHGEWGNKKLLRLVQRGSGAWKGKVHEELVVKGKTRTLESVLDHYPHQTLTSFLGEINYYTTLRSQELYRQGKKAQWFDILLYTKGKFVYDYIVLQGFRDGIEGLLLSICMSFHSFLVRSKLWLLWQK